MAVSPYVFARIYSYRSACYSLANLGSGRMKRFDDKG